MVNNIMPLFGSGSEKSIINCTDTSVKQIEFNNLDVYFTKINEEVLCIDSYGHSVTANAGDYVFKSNCRELLFVVKAEIFEPILNVIVEQTKDAQIRRDARNKKPSICESDIICERPIEMEDCIQNGR